MSINKTGQPIFWKDILFKLTCRFNSTSKVPKGNNIKKKVVWRYQLFEKHCGGLIQKLIACNRKCFDELKGSFLKIKPLKTPKKKFY